MTDLLKPVLRIWIPVGIAVSMGALGLFGITQHSIRIMADDPQVQLAQDGARALSAGIAPAQIVPTQTVDPARSLAPFVMVFDPKGKPVAGNARYGDTTPVPPEGVLATAVEVGQNRITWEMGDEALVAAVVFPAEDGTTVLAGRSLTEVEGRTRSLQQMVGMGWLFTLTVTFFATWFAVKLLRDDA